MTDVPLGVVAALCEVIEPLAGEPRELADRHVDRVAPLATADERAAVVSEAVARLVGLGSLERYLRAGDVDEVMVNARGDLWIERGGRLRRELVVGAEDLATSIERILTPLGRRLDRTSPIVDARLADGTRVCAVVPPISVGGTCLSLRRFRSTPLSVDEFASLPVAAVLTELIERRCNVVVSGATSSGKTSLLSSLLGLIARGERVVMLEDTAELAPAIDHVVRLEARPATNDGVAAITLDRLLHTALRLRPDRLVVGEVRGPEVLGLVQALNTGHDGSLSTVHANSALDAIHRLETLVLQTAPTWPLVAVRSHLLRCVDAVVHVERSAGGARRVVEIAELSEDLDITLGDRPITRTIVKGDTVVAALRRSRAWGRT